MKSRTKSRLTDRDLLSSKKLVLLYSFSRYRKFLSILNKTARDIPFMIALCFILGVLCFDIKALFLVYTLFAVLAFRNVRYIFLLYIFALILGFSFTYHMDNNLRNESRKISGNEINANGVIIEDGQAGEYADSAVVDLEGYSSNFLVTLPKYSFEEYGIGVSVQGKAESIRDQKYSEGYINYLESKNIHFVIKRSDVERTDNDNLILNLSSKIKNVLNKIVDKHTSYFESELVKGVLIGDKGNLPEDFKNNLIRSGTSHILSASGFNVTMVYIFLSSLSSRINKRYGYIVGIFGVTAYTFIVGLNNLPALRAAIMLEYVLIAKSIGRKPYIRLALCSSIILILLVYPFYWKNISFQLSVLSTIGLFLLAGKIAALLKKFIKFEVVIEIISATIACTVMTLPLTVSTFDGISTVSIITNILILPLIPLIMILGFAGIVLDLAHIQIAAYHIFHFIEFISWYEIKVITFFGNLHLSYVNDTKIIYSALALISLLIVAYDYKRFKNNFVKYAKEI